ncbi:hypothetical protein [Azospirillum sp. sgz302134]
MPSPNARTRTSSAPANPATADPLALHIGTLRAMTAANTAWAGLWPAAYLVSGSPFFWAPPLWILAMMAPADAKGGVAGSMAPRK